MTNNQLKLVDDSQLLQLITTLLSLVIQSRNFQPRNQCHLPRGTANVAPRTEPKAAVVKRVSSEPGTARVQNPLHPVNPVYLLALLDEVVNSHPLYNSALISQFTLYIRHTHLVGI